MFWQIEGPHGPRRSHSFVSSAPDVTHDSSAAHLGRIPSDHDVDPCIHKHPGGDALAHAAAPCREDREIVLTAVRQSGQSPAWTH